MTPRTGRSIEPGVRPAATRMIAIRYAVNDERRSSTSAGQTLPLSSRTAKRAAKSSETHFKSGGERRQLPKRLVVGEDRMAQHPAGAFGPFRGALEVLLRGQVDHGAAHRLVRRVETSDDHFNRGAY